MAVIGDKKKEKVSFRRRNRVIHQYKNNGYNIVMDIASGSVHVVDDVVYDDRRGNVSGTDPGNRKKECGGRAF